VMAWLEAMRVTHLIHEVPPFHGGGRGELLKQPKIYAFDTGFVAHERGWDSLRPEDCGHLWENLVLEHLLSRGPVRPVHFWRQDRREVDFVLPGCPIDQEEFLRTVRDLVLGKTPRLPNYPVCVECKRAGNVCVFLKGMKCMGPVARAGCGAHCPSHGDYCEACRGFVDHPNTEAHQETLKEHGLTPQEVMNYFSLFNSYDESQI